MTFNNNASQKERRAVIKNDASTMHGFAQSEASEISGRWAKPTQVSGSEGAVHMPRLPSNSPWSAPDPSGPEQPFGIDVSEPVVTGESWEVEASLDRDFGLQRLLQREHHATALGSVRDAGASGVRSPAGSPNRPSASAEGGEAGDGVATPTGDRGRPMPSPKSKIKRRLV